MTSDFAIVPIGGSTRTESTDTAVGFVVRRVCRGEFEFLLPTDCLLPGNPWQIDGLRTPSFCVLWPFVDLWPSESRRFGSRRTIEGLGRHILKRRIPGL